MKMLDDNNEIWFLRSAISLECSRESKSKFPNEELWACNVHKVQGLNLNKGVISFELERQRSDLCSTHLIRRYSSLSISVNWPAKNECDQLCNKNILEPLSLSKVHDSTHSFILSSSPLRQIAPPPGNVIWPPSWKTSKTQEDLKGKQKFFNLLNFAH